MKSARVYVEHMLECIQNIEEFTGEGHFATVESMRLSVAGNGGLEKKIFKTP